MRRRFGRRLVVAAAAVAAAGAVALLGGVFGDAAPKTPRPLGPASAAAALGSGFAAPGGTAATIRRLQDELRGRPVDVERLALLGLAYQQRARETGDPAYYSKADGVLQRALARDHDDALATSGLATLALARHRFREALVLGRRARLLAPGTARPYGIVGDALLELGRYHAAFASFDAMARLKPSLSAYARVAYARELLGRPRAALAAMRLAVDAAAGEREPLAWALVELGKLHFGLGELREARRADRAALAVFPGYPFALDALARVEAARARHARAVALARRAADAVPLPQFVTTLGDLYRAGGQNRLARRQYATVAAIDRVLRANGVRTDLEIALFRADHAIAPDETVALARAARRERPSIEGDDVLAWALARSGQCEEARGYSVRALRLGTKDAAKFFHRGMIERCLGRERVARTWFRRAVRLNPHFSIVWSPLARRLAR